METYSLRGVLVPPLGQKTNCALPFFSAPRDPLSCPKARVLQQQLLMLRWRPQMVFREQSPACPTLHNPVWGSGERGLLPKPKLSSPHRGDCDCVPTVHSGCLSRNHH